MRQYYHTSKALSFLLSMAMLVSLLTLPAAAADGHWVSATVDGKGVFSEYVTGSGSFVLVEDLGAGVTADVSVTGATVNRESTQPVSMTGSLPNGTTFNIEERNRKLALTVTSSKVFDDIMVSVRTARRQLTIQASSGMSDSTGSAPTCGAYPAVQSISGGDPWSVTFTPTLAGQSIKNLVFTNEEGRENTVSADVGTASVFGNDIEITRSGSSVIVSVASAVCGLSIKALTAAQPAITLTVNTPEDVTSSVSSTQVEAGAAQTVTLTPAAGAMVDSITIHEGGDTGIIRHEDTSATVNGHIYKVYRTSNGAVTLTVNAITADTTVTVTSGGSKAKLILVTGRNVDCNYPTSSMVERGSACTIRLTPGDGTEIAAIKIESDTDSVTLSGSEYRFTLDGRNYRVDTRGDSSRVLYIDSMPGDIRITVVTADTYHTVTLRADSHCDYGGSSSAIRVNDGSSTTVSFTADSGYNIEKLLFTYSGRTYELDSGNSYITIDGTRCPISWERTASRVTVTLYGVVRDIAIRATTDPNYKSGDESGSGAAGQYVIRVSSDGGAYADNENRIFVDRGEDVNVSFSKQGYDITKLVITTGGKTYTAAYGKPSVSINGKTCSISWGSNRTTLHLTNVQADMSVYAMTDYSGREGEYVITLDADGGADYSGSGYISAGEGDTQVITFVENGWEIRKITVTRGGKTYTASRHDSFVTVNGTKFPITWRANGDVDVKLVSIDADMVVRATTDYAGSISSSGSHAITRRADSHSTISLDPNSTSIRANQSVTVTVSPMNGYALDEVEFKLGNTSIAVNSSTNTFTYGGKTYTVEHTLDGAIRVYFEKLPANLTVTSTTKAVNSLAPAYDGTAMAPATGSGQYHVAYIQGYSDGLFRPYQSTSRAQALVMLVRAFYGDASTYITNNSTPYADVSANDWYAPYIAYAWNQGVLTGLTNVGAYFRPNDAITRAEYTELACRFAGVVPSGDYGFRFTDVPIAHWAYSSIGCAASRGWVNGFGDGLFRPDQTITRAQMVAITNRVLGRKADVSFIHSRFSQVSSFADVPGTFWAYYDIMEAATPHSVSYAGGGESWLG